jgi:predicted nuclease of predicted toxin-antitoxin system
MRFYADEQFPAGSVAYLRHKHGVRFVAEESELRRRDDAFHHQQAKREKRVLVTLDHGFTHWKYSVNRHPGMLIVKAPKSGGEHHVNQILDNALHQFPTAADFYEAKIIASTTGWRRITREGEERGEWEVAVREEGTEYSAVETVEVGGS